MDTSLFSDIGDWLQFTGQDSTGDGIGLHSFDWTIYAAIFSNSDYMQL